MSKPKDEFKVTVVGDGLNLSRPVSESIAQQIVALVLGGTVAAPANSASSGGASNNHTPAAQSGSPKSFMALKRPATDIERVTCLAWFLTNERNIPTFKTKELTELNQEAAQFRLSNPSATARNAVADGFLAPAGGGQKQITARGEAFVNALPDREKAKAALEAHPKGKRRKSTVKKKTKKN